jgi:hypothetical protein
VPRSDRAGEAVTPIPLRRLVQKINGLAYHFETPDGSFVARPVTGDYWVARPHRRCHWEDCDGTRLVVMIPSDPAGVEDAHEWSPHNRARNCSMPGDRSHRCWVLHGDPLQPETLHVDKDGTTCEAGGGSILFGDWHGYVNNGRVTTVHENRSRGVVKTDSHATAPLISRPLPPPRLPHPFIPRPKRARRTRD